MMNYDYLQSRQPLASPMPHSTPRPSFSSDHDVIWRHVVTTFLPEIRLDTQTSRLQDPEAVDDHAFRLLCAGRDAPTTTDLLSAGSMLYTYHLYHTDGALCGICQDNRVDLQLISLEVSGV